MRDTPEETPERKEFYDRIGEHHLSPLGQVIHRLLAREPTGLGVQLLIRGCVVIQPLHAREPGVHEQTADSFAYDEIYQNISGGNRDPES